MKLYAELLRTSVFGLCLAFTATAWAQPELRPLLIEPACGEPCVKKLAPGPHLLTALGPVFSVTEPLLAGTPYEVGILPASGPRTLQSQLTLFTRQADEFSEDFRKAWAVISISRLWAQDPFYTAARSAQIWIIPIDASKPWSHELDGVSVATSPVSNAVSPWFWLSPSNVIRMIDIIGHDLQQLFPSLTPTIAANMNREKNTWLQLKSTTENRLLEVDDLVVYALADEFVYLTSDLGIFVDAYFVKQDIDWTVNDLATLTDNLQSAGIKVVIHKWEPSEPIRAAITAAGAQLVVLDTLETTTDLLGGMQRNIDALLSAFASVAPR